MKTANVISSFLMVGILSLVAGGCYSAPPGESDEGEAGPQTEAQDFVARTPTKAVGCSECLWNKTLCEFDCSHNGEGYLSCFAWCAVQYDLCQQGCYDDDGGWIRHPCTGQPNADDDICAFWFETQGG